MFFKRGSNKVLYVLFIVLCLFFCANAVGAFSDTGYCSNPAVSYVCELGDIEKDDCCPPDDEFNKYGDEGYPDDQNDCETNFFGEDSDEISNCEVACCYFGSLSSTCEDRIVASCHASDGIPCEDKNSCATTDMDECKRGCCCYGDDNSLLSTQTYCEGGLQGDFDSTIDNVQDCNDLCGHEASPGEGFVDPEDVDDDIVPGVACPSGMYLCPSWTSEDPTTGFCCCDSADVVCGTGEYCCEGSCYDVPCEDMCESHEPALDDDGVQMRDENDCWMVYKCQPDGTLATEPTPTEDCIAGFEVCHSDSDDTGDGLMNCEDPFCQGWKCAEDYEHRFEDGVDDRCMGKGYFDINEGFYKCCGDASRLNNCSSTYDGYDTCGPCDCLEIKTSPDLEEISVEIGTNEVKVDWSHECEGQVDYGVMRCKGSDCSEESSESDFIEYAETTSNSFIDTGIVNNTHYCYFINAKYPGDIAESSDILCFTSGDKQCMEIGLSEFCLDEDLEFGSELVVRARCSSTDNTLGVVENCRTPPDGQDSEDYPNKICQGPNQYGNTYCEVQEDCERCGDPFRSFADYETSLVELAQGAGSKNYCRLIDNCFYDYSKTTKDYFRMCKEVRTCHDYRSESACIGQPTGISNNPCLSRDCKWEELDSGGGVCLEETSAYNTCDRCENTVFGGVFDVCDSEKCSSFGNCFLRDRDYQCIHGQHVTCWDYTTRQECEGGKELEIDVEYDGVYRVGGTNEIITRSGDRLGIGLCRWDDGIGCYKDADFSGQQDSNVRTHDYTKPETKILSPKKLGYLNISFQVTDFDDKGFSGSGVSGENIYFCKVKEGEDPCYPESLINFDHDFGGQRGWVDLGGATTGQYTIYYYSKDRSNNLERVKSKTLGIDRTKPDITIDYHVNPALDGSNITFLIETSKNVTCTRKFDGGSESQLGGGSLGYQWIERFDDLSDGHYQYRVDCEDEYGNFNHEEVTVRVRGDTFINSTFPKGIIDYSDVELKIKTASEAECRWGKEYDDFFELPNEFTHQGSDDGWQIYTSPYKIDGESGTYSFEVKCLIEGRVSEDRILFVYDVEPPITKMLDYKNDPVDFSAFYSEGQLMDSVFLHCEDTPEHGFGCNRTFYCATSSGGGCNPNNEITYEEPINLSGVEEDFIICYYSTENEIDNMGGLSGSQTCRSFNLDTHDPIINVSSEIGNFTDSDDPKILHDEFINVAGEVLDPDATFDNTENELDILVEHIDSNDQSSYEKIDANPDFSEDVNLEEGLNEIILTATDRSGRTTQASYYAYQTPYDGPRIELVSPTYGVASSEFFTFEVKTPEERADNCYYSFTFADSAPNPFDTYQKIDEEHIYRLNNMDFSTVGVATYQSIGVRCDFGPGVPDATKYFNLKYLKESPIIKNIKIDTGVLNRDPPKIIEYPLETNLIVETDQETICKYTTDPDLSYNDPGQKKFDGYDDNNFSKKNSVFLQDLENNKEHTYYVECENAITDDQSISRSQQESFTFETDTSFELLIENIKPESPTDSGNFQIEFETTRSAQSCEFTSGPSTPAISSQGDYSFKSAEVNLESGEHNFEVECLTTQGYKEDNFVIVVDNDPPGKPIISAGNRTLNKYVMSASWSVHEESFVDIVLYEYGIGTSPGETDVFGWKNTTKNTKQVTDLNLTEGQPYYWTVRAMDEFERWGEANVSGAVYVSPSEDDLDCSDYENKENCEDHDVCSWNNETNECVSELPKNGNGGTKENGEECDVNDDCLSGVCEDGVCQEPSCTDGVKNQGESDVDCGGPCPPCRLGKDCVRDGDCISGHCDNGVCAEPRETHLECSDFDEEDCIDDETCIWDYENETCEDLECSELDFDDCEESVICEWDYENDICEDLDCSRWSKLECGDDGLCEWDFKNELCVEEGTAENCVVEEGPDEWLGTIDSNCNGIPDGWKDNYPEYKSLMEEFGVDDASHLDFSGDGLTNLQAFMKGIHPIKGEEKPSYWLLILLFLLILLVLTVLIYVSYFTYYDSIPPNVRNYTDRVMLPLRRAVNTAKTKLLELEDKFLELIGQKPVRSTRSGYSRQGPYSKERSSDIYGARPAQQMPPSAGSERFAKGPGSGHVRGKSNIKGGPKVPTSKRAVLKDKEIENAESTKEMVEKMRKKRQEEKEKQRKQVLDKFNKDDGSKNKEIKKKSLLEKVNDTFGSENEREKESEEDKK